MDVAYSTSVALNEQKGRPRPTDNTGRVTAITVAYDDHYETPTISITIAGHQGQRACVIDELRAQNLNGIKTDNDPLTRSHKSGSVTLQHSPTDIVAALRKSKLISEQESWAASAMFQRAQSHVDMRRSINEWRGGQDKASPYASTAPTTEPPCDPEVRAQRAIRRAG